MVSPRLAFVLGLEPCFDRARGAAPTWVPPSSEVPREGRFLQDLDGSKDETAAEELEFKEHLRAYRGFGYEGFYVVTDATSDRGRTELSRIAEIASELELTIAGLGTSVLAEEPDARAPDESHLRELIACARAARSSTLLMNLYPDSPIWGDSGDTERARVRRLSGYWRTRADRALDEGMRVLWAVDWLDERQTPGVVEAVIGRVDRPNFGILFETGAAERYGSKAAEERADTMNAHNLFERFRGCVGTVHLTDERAGEGWDRPWFYAGEGTIDWERLLPAFVDAWLAHPWWMVAPWNAKCARSCMKFYRERIAPLLPEAGAPVLELTP